jgi:signal transduction histidine kinase
MTGARWPFKALGIAMVALVVAAATVEAAAANVTGGAGWLLLGALAVFAVAMLCFLLRDAITETTAAWLFVAMGTSLVLVYWLDPRGVALGMFVLGAVAPLREPRRTILWLLAAVLLAFDIVQVASGHETVLTAAAIDAGVVFFAFLGSLLLSERSRREQVGRLLHEVEQARVTEQRAAALAERARVAREVHDVLAHSLSGLAIQLEAARLQANAAGTDPALRTSVERALVLARSGLREAKHAVAALRGDDVLRPDQLGLLVEEHRLATGAPTTLTVTGEPRTLDRDAAVAVYRAAQEALSNIRKHAPAARADLTLAWTADAVTLTVVNDLAEDAAPRSPAAGSWGITGMRERAESLGGHLSAGSADGRFTVALDIPR